MAPKKGNEDPVANMQISMEAIVELVRAANSTVPLPDLRKFSGETSTAEAKEWLRSLESQAIIGRWNESQKLETARRMLDKTALSWYHLTADNIKTWKDFQKLFQEAFIGNQDSVIDRYERFTARIQKDDESASEYILEKLRLAKDIGASVQESKNAVCSGLHSG
ncbi:hypothetical protein U1Q18_046104 [Sarracenia purpurea var. burkii]